MLSDLLILKSRILDDCADSLMLLIFAKVKPWINIVMHLLIVVEMTLTGPLAIYSNFCTPRRKE
jgi:hypothetical protein